jgi:hypothetical protein
MPFLLLWLISQLKVAKDGRYYLVVDGRVKYLPKGTITNILPSPKKEEYWQPMTDRQVRYIRILFREVKTSLSDTERENLIIKMRGHLTKESPLTMQWGHRAINKLLSRRG